MNKKEWWNRLKDFEKMKLIQDHLLGPNPNPGLGVILEYLRKHKKRYALVLGQLLEILSGRGDYSCFLLVEAAEAYERARDFEKALELYQIGVAKCNPCQIEVYDEKSGGSVCLADYPESNESEIKRAEDAAGKCERKVKELKETIARNKERGKRLWPSKSTNALPRKR